MQELQLVLVSCREGQDKTILSEDKKKIMLSETSSEACGNTGCYFIGSLLSLTTFTAHHPSVVSCMNSSCQLYESLLCKAKSAADLTGLKINFKKSA